MSRLADLHRHLDGSLRLATLHSLAAEVDLEVTEAICFEPGMGLDGALAAVGRATPVMKPTSASPGDDTSDRPLRIVESG